MLNSIPGVDPTKDAPDISGAKSADEWNRLGRRISPGAKSVGSTCDGRATPLFLRADTYRPQLRRIRFYGDVFDGDDIPF